MCPIGVLTVLSMSSIFSVWIASFNFGSSTPRAEIISVQMLLVFSNGSSYDEQSYKYTIKRYIDITAGLRAVFYIARVLACNILHLPEGASPRRRYFRIARRAPRARVLYDFTARMHEDDIVYIHQRAQRAGIALKTKYSPPVDILSYSFFILYQQASQNREQDPMAYIHYSIPINRRLLKA